MRLKDRVAIVTGAGGGIGRAIGKGLAREGASVVVGDISSAASEQVAREIAAEGGNAIALQADVANLETHEQLVAAALGRFGRLDVLVNNAGIQFREPFLEATPQAWDRTFDVNLKGPFFLSQKAARAMTRGGGKILNVASIHDTVPLRDRSIYAITKGGMKLLTRSLAFELAQYKINVNSISPGAIATDMNRDLLADPVRLAALRDRIPWQRIGDAEDLVGAAIFLVSPESDYITGATLYVDGGLLLQ